MTISLQNRLTFTYALFISIALAILAVVINICTRVIFTGLVKDNISKKSDEIVRAISGEWRPLGGGFDITNVEAMGMYFVHEGYIIKVEDERGIVWDARSCDMEQCSGVIRDITGRMEGRFGLRGGLQNRQYPVTFNGRNVGNVTIETYGPFFFSETEASFLSSVNRLLLMAGIALIFCCIAVSVFLSKTIARPIARAGEAAQRIAKTFGAQAGNKIAHNNGETVRIPEQYRTRELAELSRSINELARELEEGERRQKRLTADIAHELRTPLACLQGNVEAMIDGVWQPTPERLASCHEEIIRLARLVEDLKTLTGLEWENLVLHKTEFDLSKLLQITAEQFRAAAHEKGISITLNLIRAEITADYDRLKQVFINLLSNAVKYTATGGIDVSVANAHKPDAQWEVSVADTGIGIAEDELPHIFERFYRSDKSRSRGTGGAGIGLTIAAAIVAAHGGSIAVESKAGAGSVFRVIL